MTSAATTTAPATVETIDQNTGRTITWVVEHAEQHAGAAWTHFLVIRRSNGTKVHTMWANIDADGNIVRHNRPYSV